MVQISGTIGRQFGWLKLSSIRGTTSHMVTGGNTGVRFTRPTTGGMSTKMKRALKVRTRMPHPNFSFHFGHTNESGYLLPTSSFSGGRGGLFFSS